MQKKYYGTDELPWFVEGSPEGEPMKPGDECLRDIENNDLNKIYLGDTKVNHPRVQKLIDSETWKQFIKEDIEANLNNETNRLSGEVEQNKRPKR